MDPTKILNKLPEAQRASAWDAIAAAQDGQGLKAALDALPLSVEDKSALWDMRSQSTAQPGLVSRGVDVVKQAIRQIPSTLPPGNAIDLSLGMLGGAGRTALRLADFGARAVEAPESVRHTITGWKDALAPRNATQSVGQGIEQFAELAYPATKLSQVARFVGSKLPAGLNLASRMGIEAAGGAGLAATQGNDPTTGALVGAAGPVVGAIASPLLKGVAKGVAARSEDMVLRSVKPTVTAMKQQVNASRVGLNMTAHQIARFIIDNRLTTPEKAQAIIDESEREIARLLKTQNAVTDAPQRALRYLAALEKSATKQGIPKQDIAVIRRAAEDFMETSPFTKAEQAVDALGVPMVDQNGAPIMTRVLRTDVMADEALDVARGSGKWRTKKQWGEQKGTDIEANKTVERAARDAVKAPPSLREMTPVLNREGKAITARQLLDRMMLREGNRDFLGLTDVMWATAQVNKGKLPVLGAISHWFRNGGALRAGIYSDRLDKALRSSDVKGAIETLSLIAAAQPVASHEQRE